MGMGEEVKMTRKIISFKGWLEEFEAGALAERLSVTRRTIDYWKSGKIDPTVKNLRKIRRLTKGLLTYEMMIDRTKKWVVTDSNSR